MTARSQRYWQQFPPIKQAQWLTDWLQKRKVSISSKGSIEHTEEIETKAEVGFG